MKPRDRELADLLWEALPLEGRKAWADICQMLGPDRRQEEAHDVGRVLNEISHDVAAEVGDSAAIARAGERDDALRQADAAAFRGVDAPEDARAAVIRAAIDAGLSGLQAVAWYRGAVLDSGLTPAELVARGRVAEAIAEAARTKPVTP
ncbi:hypothetical protein CRT60_00900 [Azospirillum palustre]|uniref:Uncharacterized protein n=1 Tax=Azospirillum palustre TaxID=2044885 RepID=A0A2B8BNV8_9PROT|nr:hypothetical protein [Azospirillum palustre]PGH59223.1 hypothetical protein CRT60_00900 [Azospirillum palustre]